MSTKHRGKAEQAAIRRPVGRPAVLPASHRLTVNLTADQIATAQRLGNGNASAGVRKALEDATRTKSAKSGTSGTNDEKTQ